MNRHVVVPLVLAGALLLPTVAWPATPATSSWQSCVDPSGSGCHLDGHWLPVIGGPGWPFEVHQPLGRPVRQVPPDELWLKATETGSVRAYASTGSPLSGGDPHVEGGIRLQWTGSYFKQPGVDVATYTINRSWVQVEASLAGRGKLERYPTSYAEYEIDVTITRDANQAVIHRVKHILRMEGVEDGLQAPKVTEDTKTFEGDDHQTAPRFLGFPAPPFSAFKSRYEYDATHGVVSLAALGDGESYTVTYELDARAGVDDVEPHAEAFVGDPFDAQSGFVWGSIAAPAPSPPTMGRCSRPLDAARWALHADGTVDDLYTGLTWQRCGAGRTLTGGATPDLTDDRCTGNDLGFGWGQALQGAAADRLGGHADWRLPNAKELESLVDVRCAGPVIETAVFPDTSTGLWWTSTPERDPARSRMTSFLRGDTVAGSRASLGLVRLVRDAGIATRTPLPLLSLGHPLPVLEGHAGSRDLVFPVSLDRAAAAVVTVDYQTSDITAAAGPDYLATAGTLAFPPGTTRAEVRVPVLGDTLGEPDEYLALTLSNVSPTARLGVNRQVGTILDDEPVVSVGLAKVLEGNTGITDLSFPVTLSLASASEVSLDYATADVTATGGVDYTAASGRLVIPAGQTAATIHVSVAGDRTVEPDETLTLTLSTISANATLGFAAATGTIQNDDAPGPPVVDAVRYVGSMGGPGNADGAGVGARFTAPSWITNGLVVDGGRIRVFDQSGNVSSPFAALFSSPAGIAMAPGGATAYVSDGWQVQRLGADGAVTTLAGSGLPGSADGSGTAASFRNPSGLAVDASGNVYVCDSGNFTIRRITPDGVVTTLAGTPGASGSNDGTGAGARFTSPRGLAIHPTTGLLYVGDRFAVRTVTAGGVVTTIAGSVSAVGSVDSPNPLAARFQATDGLAANGNGTVYVADGSNGTIRKIDPAAGVTTLAGTLGQSGSADGVGPAARFRLPLGIVYSADFLWVTDSNNFTLRRVSPAGEVVTMAGQAPVTGGVNGSADVASFGSLKGVAPGAAAGVLYLVDSLGNTLRRVDPDPITGAAATVSAVAGLDPFPGSADGSGTAARFRQPWGVSGGGGYVADTGNCTLRAVDAQAAVTTVAGAAGTCAVTDGTGGAARFRSPVALWTAPTGIVYVSDTYAIRAFDPVTGAVTTVAGGAASGNVDGTGSAARFGGALGLCGDAAGNLYVADAANSAIRKIAPGGGVTTLAGGAGYQDGPAASARFLRPSDVACASDGTLYVADTDNVAIRKITPAGEVSTILGTPGLIGFSPMAGPSVIGKPGRLTLQGNALYVVLYNGVMKVTLP